MSDTQGQNNSIAGYVAEYEHQGEYIRHTARERHGFLAFALAASGLILSLLMRSTPPRSSTEACFLVALAAGVTLVAEQMTIRATQGIGSAITYLRLFVEPKVQGLGFFTRYASFRTCGGDAITGSRRFAFAYLGLTAAFLLAWLAAPIHSDRQWWQTIIVALLGAASLFQVGQLRWHIGPGWSAANDAWSAVKEQEQQVADVDPAES